MRGRGLCAQVSRTLGWVLGILVLSGALCAGTRDPAPASSSGAVAGLSPDRALALGERMYRQGLLPSGAPLRTQVSEGVPVPGSTFTCLSCHLRSGLGSAEGGVVTLPANAARLFQPRYWKLPNLSPEARKDILAITPEARPAYTDATLARVLRTGVDPTGHELHPAMPRFQLSDPNMAILIHYLRSLSATVSPGVDATTIRFATVVTEEVSLEDERAMLVPMNNYLARHNRYSDGFDNRMYQSAGGSEMNGSYRKLALSVWRLKGAPETWGRQLEAYLAEEPVFALLGGISYGDWRPIHTFCETHRLPCLLPITDLPVLSNTDWYTLYFSKGFYQEGQAAARYLASLPPGGRVLQITQEGATGQALAAGFRETWRELGRRGLKEVPLGKGITQVAGAQLQDLLRKERPAALLLWTGPGSFAALGELAESARHPEQVFLSSRLLGPTVSELPEGARAFTRITYPYRDPKHEPEVSKYAATLMAGLTPRNPESRIATRVYSMIQVLRQGLAEMYLNFYRDNLLDRIGMQAEQALPDYLRLSFGPGQRYAAKGCYIMQLSPGPDPQLLRRSEWIIHPEALRP